MYIWAKSVEHVTPTILLSCIMVGKGDKTKSILNYVMLVCYSAYFVRNSSIYFHLRNGCMEQNFSERRAFLYEYDVFLFKKYVRRKGICWRLISLPFPLKTMWTPKSSSPPLTPLFRKNTRWWSLFLFSKIFRYFNWDVDIQHDTVFTYYDIYLDTVQFFPKKKGMSVLWEICLTWHVLRLKSSLKQYSHYSNRVLRNAGSCN